MKKTFKSVYIALILLFLYAPIAVMIALSFNASKSRAVWGGFSLTWYAQLFDSLEIMQALQVTLTVAVLATLVACAGDELPRRVVGIMACAENMPGGNAMRPGDVVRAASGDTVEIQNTDAEGRLALCDALDYAQKQWTPAAVVDIATLTGACAVALGTQVAGLFCDDDALAEHIRAAGAVGGENYWPLPLWKGYEDNLKSEVADICHMGPREGGAIHAALFLKHFVREGVRWAHLDIAGVDWATKKTALCPVGSTGFGARTLLELARGGV